jgi:hypothetical protein
VDTSTWPLAALVGGAATALLTALRWGRQDARDSVDAAASNTTTAMSLRDAVIEENVRLKSELMFLVTENARLTSLMVNAGLDPHRDDTEKPNAADPGR